MMRVSSTRGKRDRERGEGERDEEARVEECWWGGGGLLRLANVATERALGSFPARASGSGFSQGWG